MEGIYLLFKRRPLFIYIYAANLFLSFHYFSTVYVNSSLLSQFLTSREVSLVYIIASIANLLLFLSISSFLRIFGNYRLLLTLACIDLISVLALSVFKEPLFVIPFFFLHQALVPIILFCLDILLEKNTTDEKRTGEIRGLFLTVTNAALVLSPLLVALLVTENDFSKIYIVSGAFLIPLIVIATAKFRSFKDPLYSSFNAPRAVKVFFKNKNLALVLSANFILQFFYAFMVVYSPIYLSTVVGFSWQEIGVLFTVMLLPFLLFEFPAGALADKKYGEKEIMTIGFLITGISTIIIGYITSSNILLWGALLFLSRTGASLIEITSETYFFKKTSSENADLVGIFRSTRPLSYLVAPVIGIVLLTFLPIQGIFTVLGGAVLLGSLVSLSIKDTR